jgi:hypothetical protein
MNKKKQQDLGTFLAQGNIPRPLSFFQPHMKWKERDGKGKGRRGLRGIRAEETFTENHRPGFQISNAGRHVIGFVSVRRS